MKIKITIGYPNQNLLRQTPGSSGIWQDCEFFVNSEIGECDAWVVLQSSKGLLQAESTECPKENLILITREPPDMMTWNYKYIQQFSTVITCHQNIKHQHVILEQHGQTWHLKELNFDQLSTMMPGVKPKLASLICSSKSYTPGHRARLCFIEALKDHFGNTIDIFGRGVNPIDDKWDGIYPYKYHIVLENGQFPYYWTEKLTDAFLGFTLPIYSGCPNLTDYFAPESFVPIDINDLSSSISTIENVINSDRYEQSFDSIFEARDLILNHYNLFPMLTKICQNLSGKTKQNITLYPEFTFNHSFFRQNYRVINTIRNHFSSYLNK